MKDCIGWHLNRELNIIFEMMQKIASLSYSQLYSNAVPVRAWRGPECSRRVDAPRLQDCQHMKVVRLSALSTGRFYPQEISLVVTHFCYKLSQTQSHSADGRMKSMKNSSDPIGNRIRYVPTWSAVPNQYRHQCSLYSSTLF